MAAQRCGGLAVFHSRVAAAQQGSGEEVEVSPSHVASDDCGGLVFFSFCCMLPLVSVFRFRDLGFFIPI